MIHVTDAIKWAGLMPDHPGLTQAALDRGTAVHLATAYLDRGTLDWHSLEPRVLARVQQYERFKREVKPRIIAIEEAVQAPLMGIVGTLDRRLLINGAEGIVDLKPSPAKWHGIQLAGYALCFPYSLKRWNLYLTEHDYKLIPRTDRHDFDVFKSAVIIARWRNQNLGTGKDFYCTTARNN